LHEVPVDEGGMDTAALAGVLERLQREGRRAKLIYTIPTFHNPAGVSLGLERRRELVDIARRYGTAVLEDDAYSELRYDGERQPSLAVLDPEALVFQVRTFSKIMAAGLRLGYLVAPKALLPRLLQLKVDVGTSPFACHLATAFAAGEGGPTERLSAHVEGL